jgi:sugar transferase (PEP-CTERM system associated)
VVKLFGKAYPVRKLLFFGGEGVFLLLSLAVVLAYFNRGDLSVFADPSLWLRLLLIVFVCLLSLYYFDLYTFRAGFSYREMTSRLVMALGSASIFLGCLYFVFPSLISGRWVFGASIVVFSLLSVCWRYAYCYVLRKGWWTSPVLLVGSGAFPEILMKESVEKSDCGFRIAAVAMDRPPADGQFLGVPFIPTFSNLYQQVRDVGAETVIVAMDERRGTMPVEELLECKVKGIAVLEGEAFFEELKGKIIVEKINPSWLIFQEGFQKSLSMMAAKRLIGAICSAIGLVLTSPIILLTAVGIWLESGAPVFFRQERVGKDGEVFSLIKFRSMRLDAEQNGAKWADADDERVTRVGRVIRRYRIDEIPQMWNVLKGEMSFVGPRPERPLFVRELTKKIPYYGQRHVVQPGVTGWAQINYPYGASVEDAKEKLGYDLYYIKHMSVIMDLYIILKTVKTVLFREGSR